MKINFFSIMLSLLTILNFGKVITLFDKITLRTGSHIQLSNIFTVNSATAGATNNQAPQKSEAKNSEASAPQSTSSTSTTSTVPKPLESKSSDAQNHGVLLEGSFNADEVKLLKELSQRRDELDKYQQQLTLKENFIKTTQDSLDKKSTELKDMETKINDLMTSLDEKSNMRIKSLAKIYENMKPSDAAKIFDALDMPILLEIIRNMREQKVAPIIAQMNPQRAKDVSLEFAKIADNIDTIKNK